MQKMAQNDEKNAQNDAKKPQKRAVFCVKMKENRSKITFFKSVTWGVFSKS